jgi:hypothetical protein
MEREPEMDERYEMFEVVMQLVDDRIITKQLGMIALEHEQIGWALKRKFEGEYEWQRE